MKIDEKKTAERGHMVFYQGNIPNWYKNFEDKYSVKLTVYSPSLYDGNYRIEVEDEENGEILFEVVFFPLLIDFADESTGNYLEEAMGEYVKKNYKEFGHCNFIKRPPRNREIAKIRMKETLPEKYNSGFYIFQEDENCWTRIGSYPAVLEKEEVVEWITFERG